MRYLTLILAFVATLVGAQECPNWFCGDLEVGIQALYWKPIQCPFHYASEVTMFEATGPAHSEKTVHESKAQYDWGYRFYADYDLGCWFVGLSYQWYRSSTRSHVEPERPTNPFAPTNLPLAATGAGGVTGWTFINPTLRIEYENVNFRYGQSLKRVCGFDFYTFANVRWVDIERVDNIKAVAAAGTWDVERRAEARGVALGAGLGGRFAICDCVTVYGEFNPMALIGSLKTPVQMTDLSSTSGNIHLKNVSPSPTCVNPALDFKIAINYVYCCSCLNLEFELGYELDYYWNVTALPPEEFYRTATMDSAADLLDINSTRHCGNIGFAGPYFGVGLQF